MQKILLHNATIVNQGKTFVGSISIEGGKIRTVYDTEVLDTTNFDKIVDCTGKYILPGVIDDQVHFREPGLTHKANIHSESKAAVAGGTTSFMEMPNTSPQTVTNQLLNDKFNIAKKTSYANFSFYLGATNTNLDELLALNPKTTCGVKVFMGSSTGNMLVDDITTLESIFENVKIPIAVHCEDEGIIQENIAKYKMKYGENVPVECHPEIRSTEACFKSSSLAVSLAKKFNTRLHILHLSTAKELELLSNKAIENKNITAEVCVHHLWFDDSSYKDKGSLVRWNPAIKTKEDKMALREALMSNKLDVIATDHAPHTLDEKNNSYFKAMSGGPLVQHSLVAMLELVKQNVLPLELVVEKMCHAPAKLFNIADRGYIKEGFWADLVVVDLNAPWTVTRQNTLYKCQWSPFENTTFSSKVIQTYINGNLIFNNDTFEDFIPGMALEFNR